MESNVGHRKFYKAKPEVEMRLVKGDIDML